MTPHRPLDPQAVSTSEQPMPTQSGDPLILKLELLSDTCFSSGLSGRSGDVDLEAELNPTTGLPILRGRTLKGLLRDALEELLQALEPSGHGVGHSALADLFGRTGQATSGILTFLDGGLSPVLTTWLHENLDARGWKLASAEVRDALTLWRQQTRIDPSTGTAEHDTFRSTRVLRAGLELEARVQVSRPLGQLEKALLAAGVLALRRAGVHRSRGWGHIRASLWSGASIDATTDQTSRWFLPLQHALQNDPEQEAPLETLRPHAASPVLSGPGEQAAAKPTGEVPEASAQVPVWQVPLVVRLESPAVFGELEGDPNTVSTLPYIPGSAVLGAMAGRYLRQAPRAEDPNTSRRFQQLFVDGAVRWPNLLPVQASASHKRFWPQPASMLRPKDGTQTQFDQASPDFQDSMREEHALRPATDGFVRLDWEEGSELGTLYALHPDVSLKTHHQRDPHAGRPIDGNIYSVESLDAGQRFAGAILCASQALADEVVALLPNDTPLTLGRSRSAGYGGQARVVSTVTASPIPEAWDEASSPQLDSVPERVVITLLSDYLGLSRWGLPDPKALVPELLEALSLTALPERQITLFARARGVRGYVGVWRMPRPRWPGVAAGSVVVLDLQSDEQNPSFVEAPGLLEALQRLQRDGLGERRQEGFGRVAVNLHGVNVDQSMTQWRLQESELGLEVQKANAELARRARPSVSELATSQALRRLQQGLLEGRASRWCVVQGRQHAQATHLPPSPALLSRLLEQVKASERHSDLLDLIASFHFKGGKSADASRIRYGGVQLDRCRIGNYTLPEWLEVLGEDTGFLNQIGLSGVLGIQGVEPDRKAENAPSQPFLDAPLIARVRRIYLEAFLNQLRRVSQEERRRASNGGVDRQKGAQS